MFSKDELEYLLVKSFEIIKEQKNYIKELEQKVDDLQEALDVVLQNKCKTRKVKVKVYGRSTMDKNCPRTF